MQQCSMCMCCTDVCSEDSCLAVQRSLWYRVLQTALRLQYPNLLYKEHGRAWPGVMGTRWSASGETLHLPMRSHNVHAIGPPPHHTNKTNDLRTTRCMFQCLAESKSFGTAGTGYLANVAIFSADTGLHQPRLGTPGEVPWHRYFANPVL